ncbi:hypothetical protein [Sphingomonas immobilis]|uniref:Glycine zipper 2TM domain protein n=1 Tax=Sphingomonas immobilis TaxID=3063997 RepID=A0ABT8ZW28_9SPHN|nr:hypothetical protein [Sphingomonas sp. CA1-15]MDO7841782.1 hypothetical protein [Sphingomonas sp. CA1-15]
MKKLAMIVSTVGLAASSASPVHAKGCIRGAIAGGVAGHFAHHHAVVGAMGGCVAGHYYYKHKAREAAAQRQDAERQRQASAR